MLDRETVVWSRLWSRSAWDFCTELEGYDEYVDVCEENIDLEHQITTLESKLGSAKDLLAYIHSMHGGNPDDSALLSCHELSCIDARCTIGWAR